MARGKERETALRQAAEKVAYRQGYAGLTLANLAEAAEMPLGSLYYYFKTRDDVVDAVVKGLEARMQAWIAAFESLSDPAAALKAFTRQVLGNTDDLVQYGCPIGTLTAQLCKGQDEPGQRTGAILARMAEWAECQFSELGLDASRARQEGRMLLVQLEGAAMMAHATGDASFITGVVASVDANIDGLKAVVQKEGKQ